LQAYGLSMRKIDKLVIKNFIGPFVLTTLVVVFIFLLRFLMLYFDDFVGKDLGLPTFLQLFGYFSLITVPISLPLSILLASLMSYGNLGEHTELTAIKSAGIPLLRVLMPSFVFAMFVAYFSFWYNNKVTPWANLKGYSMLWDIRTAKVALNIREGIFYRDIPGYAIKVKKKYPDNESLKDVIVYDHMARNGNRNVTVADSGRMYLDYGDKYLIFELYDGYNYSEGNVAQGVSGNSDTQFFRNRFKKNRMVFSLESFDMQKTNEDQFKYHEYMKNIAELEETIDSAKVEIKQQVSYNLASLQGMFSYQFKDLQLSTPVDSVKSDSVVVKIEPGIWIDKKINAFDSLGREEEVYAVAKSSVQNMASQLTSAAITLKSKKRSMYGADLERWHKYTYAVACLAMFIIGASLGSIIKKGGFGLPVLIAISFFILYYVLIQLTDKNAKEGFIPVLIAVWIPDTILLVTGIVLTAKATSDARLFDFDAYNVWFSRLKDKLRKNKSKPLNTDVKLNV
jgi:lipopolysaccharide export system permease protein